LDFDEKLTTKKRFWLIKIIKSAFFKKGRVIRNNVLMGNSLEVFFYLSPIDNTIFIKKNINTILQHKLYRI